MEKNFTISKKLREKIKSKDDCSEIILNLLKRGHSFPDDHNITGIRGPYILDSDKENHLYIATLQKKIAKNLVSVSVDKSEYFKEPFQ